VAGPTGATGAAGLGAILGSFFQAAGGQNPEFIPFNSSGDPTQGGGVVAFSNHANVMPLACSSLTLYVFNSGASPITVTVYQSEGGTGTPVSTGLVVSARGGAGANATITHAINAGDTLAYQITGGNVASSGAQISTGLICH
jgi:hypothetical protein